MRVPQTRRAVEGGCPPKASTRSTSPRSPLPYPTAPEGESALRSAAELRPDVVLLDVQRPDRDGFDVADQLRDVDDPAEVVLTSSRDPTAFGRLIDESEACGFIPEAELSGGADHDTAQPMGPPQFSPHQFSPSRSLRYDELDCSASGRAKDPHLAPRDLMFPVRPSAHHRRTHRP